jgi:antitoxin (DNA-binding transcriptional repressor) of toxin-antitoxin stability system
MEVLSVRDYRNNLSASFDRADEGERVVVRRKNTLYALVRIGSEDVSLSPQQQRQVDEMTESIRRSWKQVKQMEAGEIPVKSAMAFIDEL